MGEWTTKPLRERSRNRMKSSDDDSSWMLRLTLLVTVFALLWMNRGFIKPLAMAALFAATLFPFSELLAHKIKSILWRSALLTVSFAFMFLLPIGIVAFLAADAGLRRVRDLPENWFQQLNIRSSIEKIETILPLPIERDDLVRVLEQGATAVGKAVLSMLQGLVADLPKLTIDNIVIILGIYVFLVESEAVMAWLRRFSPLSRTKTQTFFRSIGDLCSSVVMAAVASGLVQSIIFGTVLLIMGVPETLLITMTAFVLSFVPVVGTLPVSLYLIGTAAIHGNWSHVIAFAVTSGVVGMSDNFVRPYVLSGSAKLHPLIGFIAAFGALETIGFYGLFLGPVVAGGVFTIVELVLDQEKA
jgi:predicted PurR-regulated permease PerM